MRRIVDERWPVKYPPYMSAAAKDLIMRLLERKPAKRIGMLQGRANDIKQHKWFAVSTSYSVRQCWSSHSRLFAASTAAGTHSTVAHVRCSCAVVFNHP
jgi:serine/threonine protein kinase